MGSHQYAPKHAPVETRDKQFLGSVTISKILKLLTPLTPDNLDNTAIKTAVINLSSADILALNVTAKTLIAAPGAGKSIVVHRLLLRMAPTATQYANGGNLTPQYHGGASVTNIIAASVVNGASASDTVRDGIDATATQNAALELIAATAFITGTGTAQVIVQYSIH